MSIKARLEALEKTIVKKDEIYCIFVDPSAGTKIDNQIVFRNEADIPAGYLKWLGGVAIFKGIDPEVIV